EPRLERFTFEVLHDQECRALVFADVVQRADVRMVQARDRARLALKPQVALGIEAKMGRQDFDCDYPVQTSVAGAIHLTHATRTQLRLDFIGPELCSRSQTHTCGEL